MENSPGQVANPRWLPRALSDCPEKTALTLTILFAFAIRLYLSLTSYCIAGDGVAYLAMARDFAAECQFDNNILTGFRWTKGGPTPPADKVK